MAADNSPSAFSLWLAEALSGWMLPVAALVIVGVVGLLYLAGFLSEALTATVVVVALAAGISLYVARQALDPRRDDTIRALAAAAAALTLFATAWPALRTVHPGEPIFTGDVGQIEETLAVPATAAGRVRFLISGRLPERGDPSASFTLTGTREPVEGKLERTYGYARVGRGGRARVAHDHTSDFYEAFIPAGTRALKLDRVVGQLGGRLRVEAFRDPLPMPWGPWAAAAIAVLLASAAEARLGRRSDLSVAAGMAVAFGLLVTFNATPDSAVGPTVGGIVLGAMSGALAGWIAGVIVRRFVEPAPKGTSAPTGTAPKGTLRSS
ncbi:MAG: hypothetical protein ACJ79E_08340 [Anaeromyxobacteraceae bacterium]